MGKLCVSGVNMFSRYALCELVFLSRYEFSFAKDKNLFLSPFCLISFILKYIAEMIIKVCYVEQNENEFLTKVNENSKIYYVAGVSLNIIIIKNCNSLTT